MVLSVVASVLVAPVGASGDETLDTDDDGITLGTNNTSVSVDGSGVTVESGDSSVAVSVDGGDTDDGGDGDSTPREPARRADNQTLPVNYSDIPWGSLPVDVCSPPVDPANPPGSPVNPEKSPEQWPDNQSWPVPDTVVNPNDPPGSPIGHCELVDPANPPFDPTDPPRDPGYTVTPYQTDPGRYLVAGEVTLDQDGEGPAVKVITGGFTRQDRLATAQRTTVNDGQKDYVLYTGLDHEPGTREGDVVARPTVAGRSVDLSVVCAGGNCTFSAGGTPAPSQRIPVGGGDDSGGNDSRPPSYSDVPFDSLPVNTCSPPIDPANPPGSPVNPEKSPEQWPDNQSWPVPDTVVNPNDPPGSPIGHCELVDPANPPFDPTDPPRDPGYTVTPYQTDPGRYLVAGEVTLDRNGTGPAVGIITGGYTTRNRTSNAQRTTVNDGQKDYVLYTGLDHEPGTREGDVVARPTVAGRSVDLSVVCAGGNCTFSAGGTPAPSQRIPVGGGDGDSGGSGGDDGGATDDAESTAGSADASVSADAGTDGTTASASADAGDVGVHAGVTLAELSSGLPDAATATDALLDQL